MYCCMHRELVSTKVPQNPNLEGAAAPGRYFEARTHSRLYITFQVVSGAGFEVRRRAYVDFEGINLRRKFLTGLEPETITMTIGTNECCQMNVVFSLIY